MNPFQLQAEFARQWLDLANSMASAAMAASTMMGEQFASNWTRALAATGVAVTPPSGAWPNCVWPSVAALSATPSFPFASPFALPPALATWPFAPWLSALGWRGPVSAPPSFAAPVTVTWFWPWGVAWPTTPWSGMASRSPNPGADLIEQVATSYRNASGYAVAAVLGPLGAALDPRTFGQPWWQNYPKRGLLN